RVPLFPYTTLFRTSESGVFCVADPVLDPGVSPMPGFKKLQLAGGGVGDKSLVAPPVDLLEHRQLSARVWPLAAHDHPHPVWPLCEHPGSEEPGQLRDVGPVADVPVGVERWSTRGFGAGRDGSTNCGSDSEADRV